MQSLTEEHRLRIDGLAAFAAAAFATGVGVIAALERVGAPDGFVEGLGPLFAFAAVSVIGLTNRASSLTDFLAARRAIPGFYAGLAFAAILAGVTLALASGGSENRIAWLSVAGGAAFAGLVVAPAIRAGNVSSAMDVLATRFPHPVARAGFALAQFVCGALTAAAGFSLTMQSLAAAVDSNARVATAFAICALVFTLVPGGLKSAVWTDAASGAGALLIALFGAALALAFVAEPWSTLQTGAAEVIAGAAGLKGNLLSSVALALAFAFYVPLLAPAIATPSAREARGAGWVGLFLAAFGLIATAVALRALASAPASAHHTAEALASAAIWLPSLALARAGVMAASRAVGVDLARAYSRLTVLSSRRIALNRLGMLAAIVCSPFILTHLALTPARALEWALALSLAFLAPSLALGLTLPARAASVAGLAAFVGAAVAIAWTYHLDRHAFAGARLFVEAQFAASAGLALGALAALTAPARGGRRYLPPADPFVDLPFDPIDETSPEAVLPLLHATSDRRRR